MIINRIFKVSSLFIFCFLLSCGENEVKEEVVLRPVRYSEVGYVGGDKSRSFSGTAKTEKIINLSFRSSGIVTKLDMKLGQKVRKNDLLGTLDNVSARLNYESAIESKNSSESQMNTAKLALNRVRTLFLRLIYPAGVTGYDVAVERVPGGDQSFVPPGVSEVGVSR